VSQKNGAFEKKEERSLHRQGGAKSGYLMGHRNYKCKGESGEKPQRILVSACQKKKKAGQIVGNESLSSSVRKGRKSSGPVNAGKARGNALAGSLRAQIRKMGTDLRPAEREVGKLAVLRREGRCLRKDRLERSREATCRTLKKSS